MRRLAALAREIAACRACPRLVAHREAVGEKKRRAYAGETYWARPVPGFGDPTAKLLVMGLAPGAHGANRTGRVFTGDRSGDFLYAALHRAGLASQPHAVSKDDGLELEGVFITMPCRCVPPDNKPLPIELATCRPWLEREIALLPEVRAILALGSIAYAASLAFGVAGRAPPFAHGAEARVDLAGRDVTIVASYHVSQQNTQTGRLTPAMFDDVVSRAVVISGLREGGRQGRPTRVEEAAINVRRSK
jgi:uracil-DNA glycosylase family 4